jgi:ATP-binding cassette, subfamily B, bacterial
MGATNQIGWAILGLAVVYECHNLSWRACDYINYQIQPVIRNSIITQTLSHVYQHSNQFFQDQFSGSIANNVNMLADNIEIVVHDVSRFMLRNFLLLILSFFSMYWVNPIFFWILLVWSIGFIGISLCFSQKIIRFSDNYAETQSDASGQLVDALGNMQNIRLFSRRSYEINRLETFLWKTKMAFRSQRRFLLKFYYLQGLSITVTIALMAWVLVRLKSEGLVTAGDDLIPKKWTPTVSLPGAYSHNFLAMYSRSLNVIASCYKKFQYNRTNMTSFPPNY